MTESKIKEVSVYKSGGLVKREGTVHLKAGQQTVELKGLTSARGGYISADTVKLSVDERVIGSNIQVVSRSPEDIDEILKPISEQIAAKQKELEILVLQEEMWRTNSDFTGKESVSIDSMVSYIESLGDRLGTLNGKKTDLEKELEKLNKDYREHREYLEEPYVKADLTCAEEGDYAFELSYYSGDVYWYPFYEVHTDDDTDKIVIKLRAKLRQNTEEDWNGVRLSLYTADPSISGTIPTLHPYHLSFYSPMKTSSRGAGMMRAAVMEDTGVVYEEADAAPMAMMMGAAPVMKAVQTNGAVFKSNDSILEYVLEGTWDVPGKKEIICDLTTQEAACRYHDICIPKLDTKAYLAAEVKTADVEQLMDTDASIYIKGAYMGEAYMSIDLSKEEYDISLGVDETVKVTRKQVKKYSSSVLLKGQKKTELEYEITAVSKKDRKCELRLIDQIPVSGDKTIEVSADNISGGKYDEVTGEVSWDITLGSMETEKKTLAYSVAYPKDKVIHNL